MSLEHHAIVARASPRSDLLVFDIRAKITQDDVEWMSGEIESAFDAVNVIDLLIVMTNFDGAELSALTDAEALRASTRSLAHVRRYGVVGAPGWARAMIAVFNVVSPVDAKTFDLADEASAWEWINLPSPS